MEPSQNIFLITGALLSGVAAIIHLACIYFGAPLFRFLGAEELVEMYEAEKFLHPIIACLLIAMVLFVFAAYALSGAGVIYKLPFLRWVLIGITAIYLLRGLAFPLLKKYFPGNSDLFWYCSSLIVFTFGVVHLIGISQVWVSL